MYKKKFEDLFILHDQLSTIGHKLLAIKQTEVTKKEALGIYSLAKAMKTQKVVLDACVAGYGEDSAVLVRTVLELLIVIKYIFKDNTDGRIDRFFDYDWIVRKKMFDYAKSKNHLVLLMEEREKRPIRYQNTRAEVNKEADLMQEKYKYTNKGWSDLTLKEMAVDVELGDEFQTVYVLNSQFTHNAVRTINDYFKLTTTGFVVNTGPSDNWVEESLVALLDFLIMLAVEYDKLINNPFVEELDELRSKFKQIKFIN